MPIHCDIVTQEKTVFSADVDAVNLPGSEGRLGILPNHTPLLTTLGFGEVVVRTAGQEEFFAIGGGLAEVQPDKVIVLADSAEHVEEIDIKRAEQARERALKLMEEGVPEDPERYAQIRASLQRAQIRIDVARRRRRHRTMPTGAYPPQQESEE
ncbi:MAG: F0F1 ATP synthase subunit epsilon [Ardenticatenaceae bacterium]|nr:F0F1 ATP synthase subunit epsilon [Anaerolineales bacterium]MCB8922454.1 F0F1 ATP synthase subunit epsilon [Ardenticatenaceae bacterium]MCB8989923.1 F0F1 ATP synthase subunit epsilon [Ardenticatenaceae bacterium]